MSPTLPQLPKKHILQTFPFEPSCKMHFVMCENKLSLWLDILEASEID